jgi:type II secretory pathway component PulJ
MSRTATMTGRRAGAEAGFTLAELLVAFAVSSLVLAGAATAFQAGSGALEFGVDQSAAQQTARAALDQMARAIRWAGYGHPDPVTGAYAFTAVANPTSTSLTLQNDFNGNGIIDAPAGACDPTAVTERVRYQLVGTNLIRSENPADPACDAVVASGFVVDPNNPTLSYLDIQRNPTADPSLIRSVAVRMDVTSQNGATERRVVMRDEIRIRNR